MRRRYFGLLAGALADPAKFPGVAVAEEADFLDLADYHRVTGQLVAAFAACGAVPEVVTATRRRATIRHLQTLEALGRAGQALDAAGVAWAALKGPVLASCWYHDPAARTYQDLDLLVDPAALPAALDALARAGFAERNRNWSALRSAGVGELTLRDEQIMIDLHWHVVALERDRRRLRFPTADLLLRREAVTLGSVPAFTLDDADMLGHLVLHAQLNGARLLIHLRDAYVVAAAVDWATAEARLQDLGIDRAASAILGRAERVLGPGGRHGSTLAPTLGHGPWRQLNRAVDGLWSRTLPTARNPFPSVLVIASRPTAAGTAAEVVAHTAGAIATRFGRPGVTEAGGPFDPDVDGGGEPERARYLRDVERSEFGR